MTMNLSRSDIITLLDGHDDRWLYGAADATRRDVFGTDVYLRGIVEFSNHCCRRCQYCGLRAPNTKAQRYRLDAEHIENAAALVPQLGFGTLVLQSGDDFSYSGEAIAALVRNIKEQQDIAITLSLGDRTEDDFALWRDSGADRYLLKLETTDPDLYAACRPGENLADRFRRIEELRKLGYEVGSGVITGLPGMTTPRLADDLLRLSSLELDMIAAGPFVPHPQTPFAGEDHGSLDTNYRASAILRLLNPQANIPATSALDVLQAGGRCTALARGCNVIMPSLTPEDVRAAYSIYPGKNTFTSDALAYAEDVKAMIREAGYTPSASQGFSPRSTHV
ncbi:[FeFe] hydrogenase H-cluster radical SAM maturase HydE [Desulfobaculum sp. SPO524]|uniref:[FeFe] hydrogenase H-cluster radical SAM maturase HydE n=1 Tax=Desulfobaculum sp. SPO524 TaxID=3378071 RepID=UPI0038540885